MSEPTFSRAIDEAIRLMVFNKFGSCLNLTNIATDCRLWPKGIAQREIAERRGQDSVGFINIYRDAPEFDWKRNNTPAARRGFNLEYTDSSKTSYVNVTASPMNLNYSIWFWSKDLDQLYQMAELYNFWPQSSPYLSLVFDNAFPMNMQLFIDKLIDESPVTDKFEKGMFFVYRAPLKLEAWAFQAFTSPTILQIILRIFVENDDGTDQILVDTIDIPVTPA